MGPKLTVTGKMKTRYYYKIKDAAWGGATLSQLIGSLPTDREDIESYDATIVVCMLNAPNGSTQSSLFAESSDVGAQVLRLCRLLRCHSLSKSLLTFLLPCTKVRFCRKFLVPSST